MGPPKQAEKAMMGAKEAMERLATRSAVEFPMAKTGSENERQEGFEAKTEREEWTYW